VVGSDRELELGQPLGSSDQGLATVVRTAARSVPCAVHQAVAAVVAEAVPGLRFEDGGQVARVVEYRAGAGPVLCAPPLVDHLHQRLPEVRQCDAAVVGAEPDHTPNPGENTAYGGLQIGRASCRESGE